jgi:hypothetical protein
MFKFKKMDLKTEKWITYNLVGEALNGKLKVQVTDTFCPQEAQDVIDSRIEYIYQLGFENAIEQIRNSLLMIEYKED